MSYGRAKCPILLWGCEAYVDRMKTTKLQPKADKCFFIGYPKETRGYSFWHKLTNTIIVKRGAKFLEKEFLERIKSNDTRVILEEKEDLLGDHHDGDSVSYIPSVVSESMASHGEETLTTPPPVVQTTQVEDESIQQEIVEEVQTQEELQEQGGVRRSTRERRRPDFYMGLHEILVVDTEDPLTYEEALQRDDSKAWLDAMQSEIQSMYDNKVWTLVDLPDEKRTIQCKWIFKRKMDMDGNMTTYKARLVAKGFTQIHGIDYDETFSPVAMFKSIGIILAIAAFYDYEIWQMDVFLMQHCCRQEGGCGVPRRERVAAASVRSHACYGIFHSIYRSCHYRRRKSVARQHTAPFASALISADLQT